MMYEQLDTMALRILKQRPSVLLSKPVVTIRYCRQVNINYTTPTLSFTRRSKLVLNILSRFNIFKRLKTT